MNNRDIIVVGASAGGFQALKDLIKQLPDNFPAAIFIVWHIMPDRPSVLPDILQRFSALKISHAADGERFQHGRVYVAPPDHHILLENEAIRVTRGPKENRFRPSVDVLFRSAAVEHGARVTGVVLTGMLDDGASGLYAIKQQGGIAVVQDPVEAEFPDMPLNAMRAVKVDYSISLAEMGNLLIRLVTEPINPIQKNSVPESLKMEIDIAKAVDAFEIGSLNLGEKTSLTCPECHGALKEIQEDKLIRYRCHTGHAYSLNALLEEVRENIESSLWKALSKIEESEILLNRVIKSLPKSENSEVIRVLEEQTQKAREKAKLVRQAIIFNKFPA